MTPRRLPKGLRPFTSRPFRLIWAGQSVSLVGTWMQQIAQGWLVLQLTGDPLVLGLVGAAQFLPVLPLGLFGGVVADAIPKRTGLLITQSSSLLLSLLLGLLTFSGHVEVWQVLLIALGFGVVNAFDMPIRQAMVVEMVERDDVASAVALNSAVFNAARIIGPAIAGILIAVVGLAICFFINAVTYAAVIVALLVIRPSELRAAPTDVPERRVRGVIDHLGVGLSYVRRAPVVMLILIVVGVVSSAAMNRNVVLPLVASDVLNGGPETLGFLGAAGGAGSLVSAMSLAFGGRATLARMLLGAAVVGASTIALAASGLVAVSLLIIFVNGWGVVAMAATANTIVQTTTPDRLRGRVMSVYTTVFVGSAPLGNIAVGAIAAMLGIATALAIGGLVALVCVVLGAAWAIRRTDIALRSLPQAP